MYESTAISGGEIMIKVETDVDLKYIFCSDHRSRDSFS